MEGHDRQRYKAWHRMMMMNINMGAQNDRKAAHCSKISKNQEKACNSGSYEGITNSNQTKFC